METKILYSYFLVLIFGLLLLFSGYSFSWTPLNYLIITIIVIYPVIKFFTSSILIGIKIFVAAAVLIIGGIIGYGVLEILAFANEHPKVLNEWHADRYTMVLTERQGWSGPRYYQYELRRKRLFGLLYKMVDESPGDKEDAFCTIQFADTFLDNSFSIEFNKCTNTVKELD